MPISWQTFDDGVGAIPSTVGDADWGKIVLAPSEQGRSRVYNLGSDTGKYFTMTDNRYGAGQGEATTQIRGSLGLFDVNTDYSFNGTTSFMGVTDDPGGRFSFANSGVDLPFSFSAKIYIPSRDDGFIMSKENEYYLRLPPSGRLIVLFYSSDIDESTLQKEMDAVVPLNTLTHIAFTYDGSSSLSGLNVYMDGVLLDTFDEESSGYNYMTEDATTEFRLGRGSGTWGVRYFNGTILDGVLYDKELNQAEIVDISNDIPYEFNYVKCTGFLGAYISITDDPLLTFGDGVGNDVPFSISGWIYVEGTNTNNTLLKSNEWSIKTILSGKVEFRLLSYDSNSWFIRALSNQVYANKWVHFVATYDGSKTVAGLRLYLNSTLDYSTLTNGTYLGMGDKGVDVIMGFYPSGISLQNIVLHSRALSQSEVNTLYAGETVSTGILANYPFSNDLLDIGPNGLDAVESGTGSVIYESGRIVANYPLALDTDDSGPDGLDGTNTDITLPAPLWETYTNPITRLWHWVQARMVK